MSKLAVIVPFHAGEESFTSFCSRVAVANGAASLRSFAMHMGIKLRAITLGEPEVLNQIAEITGVNVEALATGMASKDENEFRINGEVVTASHFNRARFRYCPACLADDVSGGTGPMLSRPYGRLAWQVSFIRTCARHQTSLAVSSRDVRFDVRDDFSALWRSVSDEEKTVSCQPMPSSCFESYVLKRLGGSKRSEEWIDDMPLYVVGHLSETIGAAALFGKWFSSGKLTNADWQRAGDAGYHIIRSQDRLSSFLNAMQDEFLQKKKNHYSGQALYGTLFRRLEERQHTDRNYDTVREFIRRHASRTLPFGPDDLLFGRLHLPRRLHSIKTAADETGLSIKLLRSHLLHAGIVTKDELKTTPHRVFIEARKIDELLEMRAAQEAKGIHKATVGEKEAAGILGVSKLSWKRIAASFGLREKAYARVARRSVEDFLARLYAAANKDLAFQDGLLEPASAAGSCTCEVADVLHLVLSRQLKTVVLDNSRRGIAKILVNRNEVKSALLSDRVRQHLTSLEVADRLQIDVVTLMMLVESNVLTRKRFPNGGRQFYYSVEDVEHFNGTYASTSRIAAATGDTAWKVAATLREAGISPCIGAGVKSANIYSLLDVAAVYPQAVVDRLQKMHHEDDVQSEQTQFSSQDAGVAPNTDLDGRQRASPLLHVLDD